MLLFVFIVFITTYQIGVFGKTPQMGWNSWNAFKLKINATILEQTADLLVSTGLRDAGYNYLVIDDGWQAKTRDAEGRQQANATLFPNGIAKLAEYVHGKGLKLGTYSDAGIYTCGFLPGSWGYEELDAATYAEWGIDYLKYDNCGGFESGVHSPPDRFGRMRDALRSSGRDILYAICEWGYQFPWYWADQVGHSYRISGDIVPTFLDTGKDCACKTAYCLNTGYAGCSILTIIRKMREISPFARPGSALPDMDGLEIGNGDLTVQQERTQMSFWAALKSPLMISTDLGKITKESLEVLKNEEILAISQDGLGQAANFVERLSVEHNRQIWAGALSEERAVLLVLNELNSTQRVEVPLKSIPLLGERSWKEVRDIWAGKSLRNISGKYEAVIESHDTKVLLFS